MKTCTKCGSSIEDGALFCSKCGTKIENDIFSKYSYDEEIEESPPQLKKKLYIIIAAVVGFIFILLLIALISSGSSNKNTSEPPEETPAVEEPVEVDKSITLSEYVSDFNYQLRYTVDTEPINRGISDEKFISCAKTLINKMLKNPSSAQYNSASVLETDSYGRAIVSLDVSAQNGFGGWVRSEYYVCIQGVDDDGTFTYKSNFSYVDKYSQLDLLKSLNNFDEHPADEKLDGLILNESDMVYINVQNLSSGQSVDSYKNEFDVATHYVYVDTNTKKVKSALLKFNNSASSEKIEKLCVAMSAALSTESNYTSEENISNVLNLSSLSPFGSAPYYKDGYLYSCVDVQGNTLYSVTMMTEEEYKAGNYWTPTSTMPDETDNVEVEYDPNIIDTNAGNNETSYTPQTEQPKPSTPTYTNPNPINSGDTITLSGVIKKSYSDEYYIEGTSVTYVYHIDANGVKHKYTDNKVYFSSSDNALIQKYVGQNVVIKGKASPQSHGVLNITNISII